VSVQPGTGIKGKFGAGRELNQGTARAGQPEFGANAWKKGGAPGKRRLARFHEVIRSGPDLGQPSPIQAKSLGGNEIPNSGTAYRALQGGGGSRRRGRE